MFVESFSLGWRGIEAIFSDNYFAVSEKSAPTRVWVENKLYEQESAVKLLENVIQRTSCINVAHKYARNKWLKERYTMSLEDYTILVRACFLQTSDLAKFAVEQNKVSPAKMLTLE